jgi:hypothetical protein
VAKPAGPRSASRLLVARDEPVELHLRKAVRLPVADGRSRIGLLGNALAPRAGTSHQWLFGARVCESLGLVDTWITTRGTTLRRRPTPPWHLAALDGAGGLRTTAADLLAFLALQAPGSPSPLAAASAASAAPRA